jgi:hypothetical protein
VLAGCNCGGGEVGLSGAEASGDEGGGTGNGKGAGLTPTGPDADADGSGMKVLPSVGGLGGEGGAAGEAGVGGVAGFTIGVGIGAKGGGDVVVGDAWVEGAIAGFIEGPGTGFIKGAGAGFIEGVGGAAGVEGIFGIVGGFVDPVAG